MPLGADEHRGGLAAFDHARRSASTSCRETAAAPPPAHPRRRRRPGRSRRPGARDSSPSMRADASPVSRTHSSFDEIEAGRCGRGRIEPIARIDQRDRFAAIAPRPQASGTDTVVRPDERGPTTSDRCPRGRPPPSACVERGRCRSARRRARASVHGAADVSVTIELAGAQQRFEFGAGGGRHDVSLFFRLTAREYSAAASPRIKR